MPSQTKKPPKLTAAKRQPPSSYRLEKFGLTPLTYQNLQLCGLLCAGMMIEMDDNFK